MTIENMRGHILKQYPGAKWHAKVLAMPDNQVLAIYSRMIQNQGTLRRKQPQPKGVPPVECSDI